jgi:hypothetical protein
MRRRALLVLAGAAVLVLALAAPSLAGGSATPLPRASASPTPPAGGWTLTLLGKTTKVLPIATFPTVASWDGTKAGNINPSLRYVYKGQLLYKLVGMVDDAKAGFNAAKAKKGYTIEFTCLDGYKPKLSSKLLFRKGTLRKDLVVAKMKAGRALPDGEGPFRFVGGPPITQPFNNKLAAYGVIQIRLKF